MQKIAPTSQREKLQRQTRNYGHHWLRIPEQVSSRMDRDKASSPPGQIQVKLSRTARKSSLFSGSWELTRMMHRKSPEEKEENSRPHGT